MCDFIHFFNPSSINQTTGVERQARVEHMEQIQAELEHLEHQISTLEHQINQYQGACEKVNDERVKMR